MRTSRFHPDPLECEFVFGIINHPVMIIPISKFELLVVSTDSRANGCRFPEIKWSSLNRPQFTCGNKRAVHGRELVGVDVNEMTEDIAVSSQVEITVMSEVNHRVLIGGRGKRQL